MGGIRVGMSLWKKRKWGYFDGHVFIFSKEIGALSLIVATYYVFTAGEEMRMK